MALLTGLYMKSKQKNTIDNGGDQKFLQKQEVLQTIGHSAKPFFWINIVEI